VRNTLCAIEKALGSFLEVVLEIGYILLISVVTFQVLSRFLPLPFLDNQMFSGELTGYLLVFVTFFGASLATYRSEHVSIPIVVENLPPKARRMATHGYHLIYLLVAAALTVLGVKATIASFALETMSDTLPLPVGVLYLIFPTAFGTMTVLILIQTIRAFGSESADAGAGRRGEHLQ
jgi:TRAP-type C4-dicarboxylate transport system permease small subunit